MLLPSVGEGGQARIGAARVLIVGCGALGSVAAEQLARAGVGELRLVDRDIVEITNLQRQVLFDEEDAREQVPKAVAAKARLARINGTVQVEAAVADFHSGNAEELAGLGRGGKRFHLILDGTDSVETRYLLNDVCVKHSIPWVYGACVGTEGRVMPVCPPVSACLRCLFPEPPAPAELPTCDTAGVFAPAAGAVASFQVALALKMLLGAFDPAQQELTWFDLWQGRLRSTRAAAAKRPDCRACGERCFDFLNIQASGRAATLCGRQAVQVRPAAGSPAVDLAAAARKLVTLGEVQQTPHVVRCRLHGLEELRLTLFPDGRLLVHGTADPDRARSLYARYIGA